jgi:hypothetical protein
MWTGIPFIRPRIRMLFQKGQRHNVVMGHIVLASTGKEHAHIMEEWRSG